MNLLRTVAALTAVAALAAGCNDDDGDTPRDEASTHDTKPTDSTSTDESTEAPTKPALPDAATKPTQAGAEAFIEYYWDVVNYAQATGRAADLRKIESAGCDTCAQFAKDLRKLYRSGGRLEGGANTAQITDVAEVDLDDRDAYAFKVTQTVSHDKQIVVDAGGDEKRVEAGENDFVAYVVWVNRTWRVDVMDVVEP